MWGIAVLVRLSASPGDCAVTRFGAVLSLDERHAEGNGRAIAAAVKACGGGGGGAVVIPAGASLVTAPFNLTSHTVLSVEAGATLLGTAQKGLVPRLPPFPSYGRSRSGHAARYAPLVGSACTADAPCTNVSLVGAGTIDGNGPEWWWSTHGVERPRLVEMQHVRGLHMSGLRLHNAPYWTVHPIYCDGVHIRNLSITADDGKGGWGPNTDGIDPDSCTDVLIEDFEYCAGDDAIAVKSGWNWAGIAYGRPAVNITARRVSSGCRGGFTVGSEMSGGVRNITFRDSVSTGQSGIRISSELGRGGYVRDVRFENITFGWKGLEGKAFLLHVNQDYRPDNPNTTLSYFSNLSFVNLTVSAAPKGFPVGDITCLNATPCTGTLLSNIDTTAIDSPQPLQCAHATGSEAGLRGKGIGAGCVRGQ